MLDRGHHDFCIGIDELTGFVAHAIDVIAVVMREDYGVNVFGFEASGIQISHEAAGGGRAVVGKAGVHQNAAIAGHDHESGERHIDVVGGQIL